MARKLKAALAKYQASAQLAEKNEKRANHTARMQLEQKAAKAARTRAAQARSRPPWLPFDDSYDELVLLVGEGDFTFAKSFAESFVNVEIVATSLDSHAQVLEKYGDTAAQALESLAELQVTVLHGVDATALDKDKAVAPYLETDRPKLTVVFNFPHLGNSVSDQDRNIRQHQELLLSFFEQCRALKAAKVVLTLFDGQPYESWQPKQLARSAGLELTRSGRFPWESFPGYAHQLTGKGGGHTSKAQRQREARIYLWSPSEANDANRAGASKASTIEADEDDESESKHRSKSRGKGVAKTRGRPGKAA